MLANKPKSVADVLALPELCNDDEYVVINSKEMCEHYQPTVDFPLKIGHTVRIRKPERLQLIGTDSDDIFSVADGEIIWQPVNVDGLWFRKRVPATHLTQDDRFREALHHDVTCPCEWCKEMWTFIDPDGERILPGEESLVKS